MSRRTYLTIFFVMLSLPVATLAHPKKSSKSKDCDSLDCRHPFQPEQDDVDGVNDVFDPPVTKSPTSSDPTASLDPSGSSAPNGPTASLNPSGSSAPNVPTASLNPSGSSAPNGPTASLNPSGSSAPNGPTASLNPSSSSAPNGPTASLNPSGSSAPNGPTTSLNPSGSSAPSGSPFLDPSGSFAPNGPTASPMVTLTSAPTLPECPLGEEGFYGGVDTSSSKLEFFYEVLLTSGTNPSTLESDILPEVENALVRKLLPDLFPETCGRGERRVLQVNNLSGVSALPSDLIMERGESRSVPTMSESI